MLRIASFVTILACAMFVPVTSAQDPPAAQPPAGGTEAEPVIDAPKMSVGAFDPSLSGDEFKDDEWAFALRLPKGFKAIDPIQLAQVRQKTIPPESQRTLQSGTVMKMQIFKFEDGKGGSILVEAYDPTPKVSSPNELRQQILGRFKDLVKASGPPQQFKCRGNRVGFACKFDVQFPNSPPFQQYVTYTRAGTRALLVYFLAPASSFDSYAQTFTQSMTQITQREGTGKFVTKESSKSKGFDGKGNMLAVLGNLALLVAISVGVWRCTRQA